MPVNKCLLFFQLANYQRIYQDETLCRVLAGVFSCLCNEQFKNVHGRKKTFYRYAVDFTGRQQAKQPTRKVSPANGMNPMFWCI